MNKPASPASSRFLNALGLHRSELRAWALYDWANSAFATTIMVAVMPIYFANVAASNLEPHLRTAYWGYTSGISMFIIASLGPILGIVADRYRAKKRLLALSTIMGIIGTALLCFVYSGDWLFAAICYTVGHIGFAASNIFYESLLPHIATEDEIHRVSTAGYAIGYIGGGVLLAFNLFCIMKPELLGFADAGAATRFSFLSVALWWGIFSVPLFRKVPEPFDPNADASYRGFPDLVRSSFKTLLVTFKAIKTFRHAFIFLLAFWLYSDGIGTIMKMATVYGLEVGLEQNDLIAAILMVQFVGIPATFFVGWLADKWGAKRTLYLTLFVYTGITFVAYYMTTSLHFWLLASGVALVQGGSQALSRSLYALMIPAKQSAEFFGFFSFSSKFAGVLGPLLFGAITQSTGNSRGGILVVFGLFIAGILLLTRVNVAEGMREVKKPFPH